MRLGRWSAVAWGEIESLHRHSAAAKNVPSKCCGGGSGHVRGECGRAEGAAAALARVAALLAWG